MATGLQLALTTAAGLWVWQTGALLVWLALSAAIVDAVVHVIRPPRHKPHRRDPAS